MDRAIFALARGQHGVFDRSQLIDLGLAVPEIDYRLRVGRLHVVSREVYSLGPMHSKRGRWMAAVLAGGGGAVLSHRSALELWGLVQGWSAPFDVTLPRARRGRSGLRFHRSAIPEDERTTVEGIPVTTVPRALLECAGQMTERRVERLINEADVRRLYDALSLPDLLSRYPGRAGSRVVRAALARRAAGSTVTRSQLEETFVEFVDAYEFRRPEINASLVIDGREMEVDALWRSERVVVELDSRQFHDTPAAFEADRRRDRRLIAAGWRPVRITWRQLTEEPDAVARDLRRMLGG
jgi:very-short-patch-repair endonuclease